MLSLIDHGLFELVAVAAVFLIGRRFLWHRAVAFVAGGMSIVAPLVLFFLAANEFQTWLLAGLLASSMLNVALVVDLAHGHRFRAARRKPERVSPVERSAN